MKQIIYVSSITYAIKGRDILRSYGFKAYIERADKKDDRRGCGYGIVVDGNIEYAKKVLLNTRVKFYND